MQSNNINDRKKQLGRLKYGNRSGDLSKAIRCGAKTRKGTSCMSPAMKNGRCRMHGGKSTGPKTKEGIQRIKEAHFKHGFYSREAIEDRRQIGRILKEEREFLNGLDFD